MLQVRLPEITIPVVGQQAAPCFAGDKTTLANLRWMANPNRSHRDKFKVSNQLDMFQREHCTTVLAATMVN